MLSSKNGHTLMSSLDRTIPLPQSHTSPKFIRKDLNLDMSRMFQPPFKKHLIVAKAFQRLSLRSGEFFGKITRVADDTHSLSATSMRRFDQNRIANLIGCRLKCVWRLIRAVISPLHQRSGIFEPTAHMGLQPLKKSSLALAGSSGMEPTKHDLLTFPLTPHTPYSFGRWPNKHQSSFFDSSCESRTFGQEAISWMNRFRPAGFGYREDLIRT